MVALRLSKSSYILKLVGYSVCAFFLYISKCFIHMKSQCREKIQFFSLRNFHLLCFLETYTSSRIFALLSVKWSLTGGKKFQTFTSKRGREVGCLLEVPDVVILLGNFWYFGIVVAEERWSQLR